MKKLLYYLLFLSLLSLMSCDFKSLDEKLKDEKSLTGLSHDSIVDLCVTAAAMGYAYGRAGIDKEKLLKDLWEILPREGKRRISDDHYRSR